MIEVARERLLQGESSQIVKVTRTADTTDVFFAAFGWRLILSHTRKNNDGKHHDRGEDGS